MILGGLERYTWDLSALCRKLGFEPTVRQLGTTPWEHVHNGIRVVAYPWHNDHLTCVEQVMKPDLDAADHVIYMWFGTQRMYKPNSITINHGITWDSPHGDKQIGLNIIRTYIEPALQQTAAFVTVDLSLPEYCRCVIPQANNNKMIYIPNYVDTDLFQPGSRLPDGIIEVLFPRRNAPERGISLMQQIVPDLLRRYPYVRFNFAIDRNWPERVSEWEAWWQSQPDRERILYDNYAFDQMPQAYRQADIVVIPSLWAEGTSLSVLEAMACGKAIICTNVGGLANLVLPDYNGKIVHPTPEALTAAIEEYIHDLPTLLSHGQTARLIAEQAFSKTRWERQWTEVIQAVFGTN
jgi:Glycosyltransferase